MWMQKCVEKIRLFQAEALFSKSIGIDHIWVQGKQSKVEYAAYHFLTLLEYFLFGNFWHLPQS